MNELDYRATVTPTAHGGWWVEIEEFWTAHDGLHMSGDTLWQKNGVDTYARARTTEGAKRKARRLIQRHSKALANLTRETFEIEADQ